MSTETDKEEENLRRILEEQSSRVEAYCNEQTRLQNALIDSRGGQSHAMHQLILQHCTLDLSDSIEKVQENLQTLSSVELSDRNKQNALETHVARSKRVLQTIHESGGKFYPSGIPASKDDVAAKTVALATLRASIAQVEKAIAL